MEKFLRKVKTVITKRSFLATLSEKYGNPEEVRNHLLVLTKESPWLLVFFGNDIIRLDEEVQRTSAEEAETRMELAEEAKNPCYFCPLGNGMGRCGSNMPLDCEAADRI